PLAFILYADKTKLSSFGTAAGYPVIARCANLPTAIRNGNGFGGGCVVGWLPVDIKDDSDDHNKSSFANFKRAVWHELFFVIIWSIISHSKTGCWVECGDGVKRWLFPIVLMLSADYEEQCVMSLIRGVKSKSPCPICFAKNDELTNLTKTWPIRTATHTQEIIWQAQGLARVRDREALLSSQLRVVTRGLRDVNNVFWHLQNTDLHRALSFDRLYSNNSGLFGHHLWDVFKKQITDPGLQAKVDAQFHDVPRWSGLNHFQEVMNVSFTDGTKYEDISKILIFTMHNLIPWTQRNKAGWLLLRVLRSFTIIDLYLSFEEHMQLTIADGRREVMEFRHLTALAEGESPKNWNFPKMHALVHSFDDIKAKGASHNYNTKPNEKLHGPLKKSYARQTNFKHVAPQILRIEHASFVSALIHSQVDEIDKIASEAVADEDTAPIHDQETLLTTTPSVVQAPEVRSKVFIDGHIALRSQQRPEALSSFGDAFHHQLSTWLTGELVALDVRSPHALFSPTDHISATPVSPQSASVDAVQITEYQSIKVVYESKVDQKQYIDLLYCSPRFHGSERRNCVVVHTMNGPIFTRLLLIFTASVTNNLYSICMVQPLDLPIGPPRVKDAKLRLHRIRARQDKVELIFAQSIIRGVPLIRDFDRMGDFYVMDVIDHTGDLFLRCNEIFTV
ncbi:hypothetical protein BJY52DRAFT_1128463, partial [Lactarius psammicola]